MIVVNNIREISRNNVIDFCYFSLHIKRYNIVLFILMLCFVNCCEFKLLLLKILMLSLNIIFYCNHFIVYY